ncbi:hypothetical protein [uncultured Kordia sp.]|uniref:hypothetical protein n=1 Tax=uncultured Kordia sp. TaxID=507699 RepID=UPI0026340757|nr:hypothetical protein [uncultured Kordia sp.]
MIFKKTKSNLFDHLTEPQKPWGNRTVISAAGIIAGGWTIDNKIFLLSSDGYSISNPLTGEREIRNRDEENTAMSKFSKDNLEFTIDELNQTIKVFGLRGGNGNHITSDQWNLDSFHLGIGEQIVGLRNFRDRKNEPQYWKNFDLIKLERLENFTLTYGFSPNEKHFGIFGSGGAEIFSRE